jgi:peptidoglycan/LPS O-acetylase OafA/YrhL
MALRLGRIYPLHIFMLLVFIPYVLLKQYMYSIGLGANQFEKNNIHTLISNILLLHSMGLHHVLSWNVPSWSISTEFYVYIVFYIFSITLDKGTKLRLPLLIVILSYLFLANLGRPNLDITFDFGFFRCLGAFYLGVFVFRIRPLINEETFSLNGSGC